MQIIQSTKHEKKIIPQYCEYDKGDIIDNKYRKAYAHPQYESCRPRKVETPAKLNKLINSVIEKHTWYLPYLVFLKEQKDHRIYASLNAYQYDISPEITQKMIDQISGYPIYKLYVNDTNTNQNLTIPNFRSFEINLHDKYNDWEHVEHILEMKMLHERLFLDDLEFELYHENGENINLSLKIDKYIIDLTIRILPTRKQKLQMYITMPNMMQLLHLHLGFIDHYIYKMLIYLQEYIHPQALVTLDNLKYISKELIKFQMPNVALNIFPNRGRPWLYLNTEALMRSSFGHIDISTITIPDLYEYNEQELRVKDIIYLSVKRPPTTIKFSTDGIEGMGGDVTILALKAETCYKNLFIKSIDENTTEYLNEITITQGGSNIASELSFLIDTKIYKKYARKQRNIDNYDSQEESSEYGDSFIDGESGYSEDDSIYMKESGDPEGEDDSQEEFSDSEDKDDPQEEFSDSEDENRIKKIKI